MIRPRTIDAACLALIVAFAVAVVPRVFAQALDAKRPAVVMFSPPEREISEITNRDISIQEFLAYSIEIEKRIRHDFPSVAMIESDADTIVIADHNIPRRETGRGFGFILYAPSREPLLIDGVKEPDDLLREAHQYFDAPPAPAPLPTPPPRAVPPLPAPLPVPVPPAPETLPSSVSTPAPPFAGTWRGNVRQFLAKPYSVVMEMHGGNVGSVVGSIVYPEVPCKGSVRLLKSTPTLVLLAEQIESGICVAGGMITLTVSGPRTGEWLWYDSNGNQRASSNLTKTREPSPEAPQLSRFVGTVASVDPQQQTMQVTLENESGRQVTIAASSATQYRGFTGLADRQMAALTGLPGLLSVRVGDRISVQGQGGLNGRVIGDDLTLLGRPIAADPRPRKTGRTACTDFRDEGTLPLAKNYFLAMEFYGVDKARVMSAVTTNRLLPNRIRVISQDETTGIIQATADVVPGAKSPDYGRDYKVIFRATPTADGVKLAMEVHLLTGQFCTNGNAVSMMCDTLVKVAARLGQ